MSFEVRATYPFEDVEDMVAKDAVLREAAGRHESFGGCGACRDLCGGRELGWSKIDTFDHAYGMKQRLEEVPETVVILREE